MDPFIGQVILFAGNFAPRGWAFCNGQLLQISTNTALFSILGTTYGGDGRTTFALPDLRGRAAISPGNGPGLGDVRLGAKFGSNSIQITQNNIPPLTVKIAATSEDGDSEEPVGKVMALSENNIYGSPGSGEFMADAKIAGGGQPINYSPPVLGLNYIIALQGVFPSRS